MSFPAITLDECLRASDRELSQNLITHFGGLYPAGQPVRLEIPLLLHLQEHLLTQSKSSPKGVKTRQRLVVAQSKKECKETAALAGDVLHEVSKQYGARAGARVCARVLSYRVLQTARFVAMHQLAGRELPGSPWLAVVPAEVVHPRKVLHVHGTTDLIELTIRRESQRASSRLYVPANTFGDEFAVSARQVPLDVWIDYVIPQCLELKAALGGSIYCSLTAEAEDLVSEDDVDDSLLGPPLSIGCAGPKTHAGGRLSGDDAKALLHAVSDPPASSEGPVTFLPPSHLLALSFHSTKIHQAVERVSESAWRAPSAWHAALWLKDLLGWDRKGRPRSPRPTTLEMECAHLPTGPFLFRGQADSSWPLTPTLHRQPSDANRMALSLFLLAVSRLAHDSDGTSQIDHAIAGVGQHYGLATTLLDFTFDPCVAAYFACDSRESEPTEAAIYGLPLARAYERGGIVVLAPPWVERLHRQLGCFVDCDHLNQLHPGGLKADCFSVHFPRDSEYCTSEFIDGQGDMYPESQWLAEAVKWSRTSHDLRKLFKNGNKKNNVSRLLATSLVKSAGTPQFMFNSALLDVAERQLSLALKLVKWAALSLHPDEQKFLLDCNVIHALTQHNPGLFVAFGRAARYVLVTGSPISDSGDAGLLAKIIECMLKKNGDSAGDSTHT